MCMDGFESKIKNAKLKIGELSGAEAGVVLRNTPQSPPMRWVGDRRSKSPYLRLFPLIPGYSRLLVNFLFLSAAAAKHPFAKTKPIFWTIVYAQVSGEKRVARETAPRGIGFVWRRKYAYGRLWQWAKPKW